MAEVYQNENLRYTGFSVSVPAASFTGVEEIRFIELGNDRSYRYEDVVYRVIEDDMNSDELMSLPVRSLEGSPNNTWVDYCNGVAQTEERLFHIADDGADILTLKGWTADLINGVPFSSLYVKVGDEFYKCCYGGERSTVAEFYQNETLRYTGFSVRIPADKFIGLDYIEFIGVGYDGSFRYENVFYGVDNQKPQTESNMEVSDPEQQFSSADIISTAVSGVMILIILTAGWAIVRKIR